MAWQDPKLNWTSADGVSDEDMIRIEGNAAALREQTVDHSARIDGVEQDIGSGDTPTFSPPQTSKADMIALPSDVKEGQLKVGLKGFTAQNLVTNGDFRNGITGWTPNGCSITSVNGELICTHTSPSANAGIWNGVGTIIGNTYYIRCSMFPKYSRNVTIGIGGATKHNTVIDNTWNTLTDVMTATTTGSLIIYHDVVEQYAVGDTWKIDNVMAIDLTATFGAGNEPTKEQCDIMFNRYFEGLQGVGSHKVKAVGKNLLDKSKVQNSAYGIAEQIDNGLRITGKYYVELPCKLIVGQPCTVSWKEKAISGVLTSSWRFLYADGTYGASRANGGTFTPTQEVKSLMLYVSAGTQVVGDFTDIQLYEGTTATPYEPYQSSELDITLPEGMQLHRLPNGVCDTIEEVNGIRILVKRTKEYILKASDFEGIQTGVNVQMTFTVTSILPGHITWGNNQDHIAEGYQPLKGEVYDNVDNVGKSWTNPNGRFYFIVAKGTYATLAQAQSALSGTKIVYELATPEIIPIGKGNLIARPNGHIIVEHNGLHPEIEYSYPANLSGRVSGNTELIANLDKSALRPGLQGGIGTAIPSNAELLGGKDKEYFEALVNAVSEKVTKNILDISTLTNNLANMNIHQTFIQEVPTLATGWNEFYKFTPLVDGLYLIIASISLTIAQGTRVILLCGNAQGETDSANGFTKLNVTYFQQITAGSSVDTRIYCGAVPNAKSGEVRILRLR